MKKEKFLTKHNLTEQDYRNLIRYEKTRSGGVVNMYEYLFLMKRHGINGGEKLAEWIVVDTNYQEFLSVYDKEQDK